METVSRQQLLVYAAAALAIALIGARYLKASEHESARPTGAPAQVRIERPRPGAQVYVTGAVRRPGVYSVPPWARLELALRKAGGPRRSADLAAVNLAAKVSDGQQVVVPRRGAGGGTAAGAAAAGGAASGEAPVSLNTATAEQLDQLDGVGPVTAKKILDWRRQHGGFGSVDDLKQISGIGPKRFEDLKDKVRM
jgi:competence protein ComEA